MYSASGGEGCTEGCAEGGEGRDEQREGTGGMYIGRRQEVGCTEEGNKKSQK